MKAFFLTKVMRCFRVKIELFQHRVGLGRLQHNVAQKAWDSRTQETWAQIQWVNGYKKEAWLKISPQLVVTIFTVTAVVTIV